MGILEKTTFKVTPAEGTDMGILLALLIFVGFVVLLISISKDQSSSDSKLPSSDSKFSSSSVPKTSSLEFSADFPELSSELNSKRDGYVKLYKNAMELYKNEQIEIASTRFREASNLMKKICDKYPNNLQVNFHLLEAYQGCDWNQAIYAGFKCLEIVDKLLCQNNLSQQKLVVMIFNRCDVLRKLYKLLIKENRISEARSIVGELLDTTNSILKDNPPPYNNEMKHIKMYGVSREGLIASFFLKGIREGRNVQQNLIVSPITADDSPELGYYFDAKFSSADVEILNILRNALV